MSRRHPNPASLDPRTLLVTGGRDPIAHEGAINPPVQRASTIVFDKVSDLYDDDLKTYGLQGMSTQDRLAEVLTAMAGGVGTVITPSGLAAITLALMTFTKAGDHVLVTDSAYGPTRRFCDTVLAGYGVSTTYYDPQIGAGIDALITDRTTMIVLESPGSLTFEMQDVPAITEVARKRGVTTMIDDTWSAGHFYKPLAHGVDISMQALTKYQAGHSDVLAGSLSVSDSAVLAKLLHMHRLLGMGTAAEECWLTLRGLRTMAVRMEAQDRSAREIAGWLASRPEVAQVLHPALPGAPGHAIWARDFTGAGGLFSIVLNPVSRAAADRFAESMNLFSLGFSWGGYESLILPCDPQIRRTAVTWTGAGPLVRLSIGLEATADLIADLEQGLGQLHSSG
jgi:cysteine-S-conjugate beta-lyase